MESIAWVFLFFFFFFGGGGAVYVRSMLESRQRHKVRIRQVESELARAEADRERALADCKLIEMRMAELEIERFDRQMVASGITPPPHLEGGVGDARIKEIVAKVRQSAAPQPTSDQPEQHQE